MPSQGNEEATAPKPQPTPVKSKKEMQEEARKKAREAIYKDATSTSPKKSGPTTPKRTTPKSATPKNTCSTTPKKSKQEQLERARAYGENLKKKNASPLPSQAPAKPVPAVFVDLRPESHDEVVSADSSEFESAKENESTTSSSKSTQKIKPATIEELKRLRDEAELRAAKAGAKRDEAEARRACLQALIDENEEMDCD